MNEKLVILGIFLAFAVLEAIRGGFFKEEEAVKGDGWVDLISTIMVLGLVQPLIILVVNAGMGMALPAWRNALAGVPVMAQFFMLLIFDDLAQYWWHRASHTFPLLYHLHRPHHNARYLSVRIVYRNNIFYYAMMPGIWLSALLVYLGFGWVYAVYLVIKLSVIMGAHSSVRWDTALYRIKWLSPLMWVVERTISTPSTHSMHHGRHKADGVTHYKGNFGNLLFFWDVLFGTARISRQYPSEFGVENLPEISAAEQLVWPLVRTKGVDTARVKQV